jgi:Sec-independent protein secretion pathway component TatC
MPKPGNNRHLISYGKYPSIAIMLSLVMAGVFVIIGLATDLDSFTGVWLGLGLAILFGVILIFLKFTDKDRRGNL